MCAHVRERCLGLPNASTPRQGKGRIQPRKSQGVFARQSSCFWVKGLEPAKRQPTTQVVGSLQFAEQCVRQSTDSVHAPAWHTLSVAQVPHEPPHPLSPHTLPLQLGVHAPQVPVALHAWPTGQVPQLPPQPLSPQVLPEHFGSQAGAQLVSEVHTSHTFAQQSPLVLHVLSQ